MAIGGREKQLLHQLAWAYGVQTAYRDAAGRRRQAAPHALLTALQALGAPVERFADVPAALRERSQECWRKCCEPVKVVWLGQPAHLPLRFPARQTDGRVTCRVELENGEERSWSVALAGLPGQEGAVVEGVEYQTRLIPLPAALPPGYHRVFLSLPGRPEKTAETMLICVPDRMYGTPAEVPERIWGVFLPLYALHSGRSWGAGDFTELENLGDWVAGLGGSFVGTLPLLATFLDVPFEPSPYAPASRLFWNEFYLDVTRVPELAQCAEAREVLASPAFQEEIAAWRAAPLVDYRRIMAAKRKVLALLARCCFVADSRRQAELRQWVAAHPEVQDYARFRAAGEKQRAGWLAWPERMRAGVLEEGDYDPAAERYHLYVQWLAREQLEALAAQARQRGGGLYLDLPLGVHAAGYDVWRERAAFALKASAGAPPDAFFPQGQNWGFPPLHPEQIREQSYRYYLRYLRHHLQYAGILRIDHVMGFHRLFWVPAGLPPEEGVYVRYPAEEFYAILALESHRYRTLIVGEDLGTVPRYVRTALARHGVRRMYVLPFEFTRHPAPALRNVPANSLACLNTHDLPPFAAFWQGGDQANRMVLPFFLYQRGWLPVPTSNPRAVLRGCLAYLAASRAQIVLVNLEDLWLETEPQNVPGTGGERPNWRRKARYPREVFTRLPEVLEVLREINGLRNFFAGRDGSP